MQLIGLRLYRRAARRIALRLPERVALSIAFCFSGFSIFQYRQIDRLIQLEPPARCTGQLGQMRAACVRTVLR